MYFPLSTMTANSTTPMASFLLNFMCTEGGAFSGNVQHSVVVFNSLAGLTASVDASQWLVGNTLLTGSSDTSHDHGNKTAEVKNNRTKYEYK